jgi:hypothetical protein
MLGNEEVKIRARLLKVGDYLARHYDRWEGTYYGGFITYICPSDDPVAARRHPDDPPGHREDGIGPPERPRLHHRRGPRDQLARIVGGWALDRPLQRPPIDSDPDRPSHQGEFL